MTLYFLTYSILHDYFMLLFIKMLHENKGMLFYDWRFYCACINILRVTGFMGNWLLKSTNKIGYPSFWSQFQSAYEDGFMCRNATSGPARTHGCMRNTWNGNKMALEPMRYGYVLALGSSVTFLRSVSWTELQIHKMNIKNCTRWDAYMNENVPQTDHT